MVISLFLSFRWRAEQSTFFTAQLANTLAQHLRGSFVLYECPLGQFLGCPTRKKWCAENLSQLYHDHESLPTGVLRLQFLEELDATEAAHSLQWKSPTFTLVSARFLECLANQGIFLDNYHFKSSKKQFKALALGLGLSI